MRLYIPFWLYSNENQSIYLFVNLSLLYIPFWLYSNVLSSMSTISLSLTLHSILVIFQYVYACHLVLAYRALHSILVIFQFFHISLSQIHSPLYIPFWLYSNKTYDLSDPTPINFTFHSGYIPIVRSGKSPTSFTTLHSILVIFQLSLIRITQVYFLPLHSILVIFQCIVSQIITLAVITLHSILVIFQSGLFVVTLSSLIVFTFHSGYIPILQG